MSPEQINQQRQDALERANRIRTSRKDLKRDLAIGKADARTLLASPPEFIQTMKVGELLLAVPKVGKSKRNKILSVALQGRDMKICALSPARREAVATQIP